MQWSDPVGASTNDYDLFRLNSTLTSVLASSTNVQTGTQDPVELVSTAANTRLVVVRRPGAAPRFISLTTNRGRLQYATRGQTRGHSAAATAFGVACHTCREHLWCANAERTVPGPCPANTSSVIGCPRPLRTFVCGASIKIARERCGSARLEAAWCGRSRI
jgi:hypothetical protein